MNYNNIIFSFLAIFIILLNCCITVTHGVVEDEPEFNYQLGSEIGPENWGEIRKEWAICENGKLQSPIDLSDKRVTTLPHLGKLRRSYRPVATDVVNRGHDIMVQWEGDAGSISINGTEFGLKQLHWHFPSEHTINGHRYALEMHMVHKSADEKQIAVVGILYTIGHPDTFLAKMEKYIKLISKNFGAKKDVGVIDPRQIKKGSSKYYRYLGSLTTPPCIEGVIWTILTKIRTVSSEQVAMLKDAVDANPEGNARPVQEINDRLVGLYEPQKQKVDL